MIVSCNKLRGQHDDPVILRVWHVPYMMPCTRFLMPQDLERAGVFSTGWSFAAFINPYGVRGCECFPELACFSSEVLHQYFLVSHDFKRIVVWLFNSVDNEV